jgi:hypothetical protein
MRGDAVTQELYLQSKTTKQGQRESSAPVPAPPAIIASYFAAIPTAPTGTATDAPAGLRSPVACETANEEIV